MKQAQMTKEQKQKVALVALSVIVVISLFYRFAIIPFVASHAEAEARRDELQSNLDKAEMVIRGEAQSRKQSKDLRNELERIFSKEVPPPDSALAWVSQAINAQARQMKLDVRSIAEDSAGTMSWDNPELAKRSFKPYAVRVEFSCSFDKVRALVRSLQQSNPCLAVASISVTANPQDVEKPGVVMVLEWPSWKDPKRGLQPFAPVELKKEKNDANQKV